MPKKTDWKKISSALDRMADDGPSGFEGLVGALLGQLLGQTFLIARKGDQPGGDGQGLNGQVRFQSKHYTKAKIPDATVEADFYRILAGQPELEVYVVATTNPVNEQLRSRLNKIEALHGIDVVTLDYGSEGASLALLLTTYWEVARSFSPLDKVPRGVADWIGEAAKQRETIDGITRLRGELLGSTRLFETLRQAAQDRFRARVGLTDTNQVGDFTIRVKAAVQRRALRESISKWLQSEASRVILIEGEEGMGKSWAVASAVGDFDERADPVVLWLDSSQWSGVDDLKALLASALACLPLDRQPDSTGWERKLRLRWAERLCLVLDGVNERRESLLTAQTLLRELRETHGPKPRLIFTSRPLKRLHAYAESDWGQSSRCSLGPFDEVEFSEALAHFSPPLIQQDIPKHLGDLARTPRLLPTCVRLRSEFGGFATVTRQMVLWAELLDKIRRTDPQVRQTLGWREDEEAAEVIARLAKEALESGGRELPQHLLQECFSADPKDILVSLEELRMADRATQMRTSVTPDVNLLGLALFIREHLRQPAAPSVTEQADRFRLLLEPLADTDDRVRALLAALQLSWQFPPAPANDLSRHRAALLVAWALHRNADVHDELLQFWADHDVEAYVGFVEHVFEEAQRDPTVDVVLQPLVQVWRASGQSASAFKSALERWLLFTWPDGETRPSDSVDYKGHRLPVAKTTFQLRLTLAALHVLSARPDNTLLPALALSWATLDQACQTRLLPKTAAEDSPREPHKHPLKCWDSNFRSLLRRSYTESVLSELLRLAQAEKDQVLSEGFRQLANGLGLVETPAVLALPPTPSRFVWNARPPIELLKAGKRLFPGTRDELHVQSSDFPHLVIRDDLPKLHPDDAAMLVGQAEQAIASGELASRGRVMTEEDYRWEHTHVWLARLHPKRFLEATSDFRMRAFQSREPLRSFLLVEDYLHDESRAAQSALLEQMLEFWRRRGANEEREGCFLAHRLHLLALLNFGESHLKDWLAYAVGEVSLREAIAGFAEFDFLVASLPKTLNSWVWDHLLKHYDDPSPDSDRAREAFDYWCILAAATAEPSDQHFDLLLSEFRRRSPEGDRQFHWLQLLWAVAPDERLRSGLEDGSLCPFFDNTGCYAMWSINRRWEPEWLAPIGATDLLEALPVDEVGKAMATTARCQEFEIWGKELFGRAMELIGKPPPERRYWGQFSLEFDSSGHVSYQFVHTGTPKPESDQPTLFQPPPGWNPREWFSDGEHEANEALKLGNADYRAMAESPFSDHFNFGGLLALSEWRRRHPKMFLQRANLLLTEARRQPGKAYHLASLLHAVICNLLALEPDAALAAYRSLMESDFRVQCNTEHKIPQFEAALWNLGECNSPRHREIRRERLLSASNEVDVVVVAIAAQGNGGSSEAMHIAEEFCQASVARERAIGVSLLAWLAEDTSERILEHLATTDPAQWLRRHAQWALEVNRQESAGVRFYRRLLGEPDAATMSVLLAQMLPSLTPAARCWRRKVEDEYFSKAKLPEKHRAVLINFWRGWNPREPKRLEIMGRMLGEWRFGEKLSDLTHPAPMPLASLAAC